MTSSRWRNTRFVMAGRCYEQTYLQKLGREFCENFLDFSTIYYIFRGPSTCVVIDHSSSVDISFRSTPFVASTGSLPPLPRRHPPRISPRPFLRLSCFPLRSNLIQHCILWRIFPRHH